MRRTANPYKQMIYKGVYNFPSAHTTNMECIKYNLTLVKLPS